MSQPATSRVIIPVSLRKDTASALRALADRSDMPASVLIRQAVNRMLQQEGALVANAEVTRAL